MVKKMTTKQKCICGYEAYPISGHLRKCKQYRDWLNMLAKDTETINRIKKVGIKAVARELHMGINTLKKLFKVDESLETKLTRVLTPPIETETVMELTTDQIIACMHKAFDDSIELKKVKKTNEQLNQENGALKERLNAANKTISELRDQRLEPVKFRIEREIMEQAKA